MKLQERKRSSIFNKAAPEQTVNGQSALNIRESINASMINPPKFYMEHLEHKPGCYNKKEILYLLQITII